MFRVYMQLTSKIYSVNLNINYVKFLKKYWNISLNIYTKIFRIQMITSDNTFL